jgi:hypothetical protein
MQQFYQLPVDEIERWELVLKTEGKSYIIKQLNGNSSADGNSFNRPMETVKHMFTVLTDRWKKNIKRKIKTILSDGNSFNRDKYSFNRQKEVDLIGRCQQCKFSTHKLTNF